VSAAELVLCGYCDTVHRRAGVESRKTARCVTCDSPLYKRSRDLGAMLAVSLTALIAFVVANLMPLLTLTTGGQKTQATLWEAIVASYNGELPVVAATLFITLMLAPALEIGILLWVLVPLCLRTRPVGFASAMWTLHILRPWRLVEVFFLGVVVAIVKLSVLATSIPGWGLFGIAVMTVALASLGSFDQALLWQRADEAVR
jgi:paraquat-inducible protein A